MKIIIFGPTGKTGLLLTEEALLAGHLVTALVRSPEKMTVRHVNLTVVEGDLFNQQDVEQAVRNHDLVLVLIGNSSLRKTTIRTDGTERIVGAMKKAKVSRMIVLSALGIGNSRQQRTLFAKLFLSTVIRNVMADHATQEEVVMQSGLTWTIVRPFFLTDGAKTGSYRYGLADDMSLKSTRISRADVADFIAKQIDSAEFLNEAVTLI